MFGRISDVRDQRAYSHPARSVAERRGPTSLVIRHVLSVWTPAILGLAHARIHLQNQAQNGPGTVIDGPAVRIFGC